MVVEEEKDAIPEGDTTMQSQSHSYLYEPQLHRLDDLRREAAAERRAHLLKEARRERVRREEAEGRVRRLRARFARAA